MTEAATQHGRVLLVTGMSGAGKSSALKVLEDLGWEVIDNLPLSMLDALLAQDPGDGSRPPLALGIDSRTRGFDPDRLLGHFEQLRERRGTAVSICFLDADADILQRRFTETRRRHPLAADRTVMDGIRHERNLMAPVLDAASITVDTSDISVVDLREFLQSRFALETGGGLSVIVTSFSFRRGLPRDADLVFDVRFLRNPYYVPELKELSGLAPDVQAHIRTDPGWEDFRSKLASLLDFLTPRYGSEGKSYLTIAFGCTGGRHRSVYCTELFAERLRDAGHHVTVRHRDLGR